MRNQKSLELLKPETILKSFEKILKESQEYEKKGKFWNAEGCHIKADYMLLDLIEVLMKDKKLAKKIRKIFSKFPFGMLNFLE